MSQSPVYLHAEGEVAHLVLNRPERRNALSRTMWRSIAELVQRVADDKKLKVLVVRGTDASAFAAGADISEFEEVYATEESTRDYFEGVVAAMQALAQLDKASVAMIQGPCVGGGCGLALACDVRFADRTARLGITPAKLGLAYTLEDTKRLVDVVGASTAKDLLFTGRITGAEEALRIGLIDRLYGPSEIGEQTRAWAEEVAAASQFSVAMVKRTVRRILDGQYQDDSVTRQDFFDAFRGTDFAEGTAAFLEKRKPRFPYA
ncbi:MAG: Enoyl-CoA hydratase/isomerase [Rhodospirillales bacterium]|jgi:enoyl-CoA hydratase|nr:Enoyl-CoA hydratase/isomerase [Rhodospirillales bacterium]